MRCTQMMAGLAVGVVGSAAVPALAASINCVPLQPGSPANAVIEDTVKAQANVLLRSLGSGSIENGYRHVESDALAKYPSADKLMLWREYIYVSCTLLAASSQWNDDEKWDKWMQLMNRWDSAPEHDPASSPSRADVGRPAPALSGAASPVIGGIGLGTALSQLRDRKDIALSLDADGNTYGEELFTFFYGMSSGRPVDGNVVFLVKGNVVASITVTHALDGIRCADSTVADMILNQQIRDWGSPVRRVAIPGSATAASASETSASASETDSYTFRRDNTDMVLVLDTSRAAAGDPQCRVSINYQRGGASG